MYDEDGLPNQCALFLLLESDSTRDISEKDANRLLYNIATPLHVEHIRMIWTELKLQDRLGAL